MDVTPPPAAPPTSATSASGGGRQSSSARLGDATGEKASDKSEQLTSSK